MRIAGSSASGNARASIDNGRGLPVEAERNGRNENARLVNEREGGRENLAGRALTTETRYRCVVIYNDYRRDPGSRGGWRFPPPPSSSLSEPRETTARNVARYVPMALDYPAPRRAAVLRRR